MSVANRGASQIRELHPGETHLAHQAMRELRTAYEDQLKFAEYVDGVLRPTGYRLIGVFSPHHEQAVAVAGFRIGDSLAWGHYLYVDDLSTSRDARRQGHAGASKAPNPPRSNVSDIARR